MSTKADSLLHRFGANIAQTVAIRPGGPSQAPPAPAALDKYDGAVKARTFAEMPVEAIVCGPQPRSEFDPDDLRRLAESIRRFGQLAPIRVRHDPARAVWVVLVGERRLRACKLAGLERVRVEFVERDMTESDILAEQVVENAVRADLQPVEQARAYDRLMALNGWSRSNWPRPWASSRQASIAASRCCGLPTTWPPGSMPATSSRRPPTRSRSSPPPRNSGRWLIGSLSRASITKRLPPRSSAGASFRPPGTRGRNPGCRPSSGSGARMEFGSRSRPPPGTRSMISWPTSGRSPTASRCRRPTLLERVEIARLQFAGSRPLIPGPGGAGGRSGRAAVVGQSRDERGVLGHGQAP